MSIQDMTMSDLCDIAEGSLRRLREGDSSDDLIEQLMGLSSLRMASNEMTRRLIPAAPTAN